MLMRINCFLRTTCIQNSEYERNNSTIGAHYLRRDLREKAVQALIQAPLYHITIRLWQNSLHCSSSDCNRYSKSANSTASICRIPFTINQYILVGCVPSVHKLRTFF